MKTLACWTRRGEGAEGDGTKKNGTKTRRSIRFDDGGAGQGGEREPRTCDRMNSLEKV